MGSAIKVKDLIEKLRNEDPEAEVYLGAQGYSNYNADEGDYWSDSVGINIAHTNNGGVLLRDNCRVEGEA